MSVESLNCPNCGAPLHEPETGETAVCVYCNSLIRMTEAKPVVERDLDAEEMNSIKQLVTSGEREEASIRYQALTGLDGEQAESAIDKMAEDFTVKTVFNQQLTRAGMIQVILSVILLPASILGYEAGVISPVLALIIVGLSAFTLYAFGRGALTTLRYWRAPIAKATTINFTQIGTTKRGKSGVTTFLFLLKVEPDKDEPFMARAIIPVRDENVEGIKTGVVIAVKYLPGVADSVIFHQR